MKRLTILLGLSMFYQYEIQHRFLAPAPDKSH
jgi:hypothetical protein